MENRIRMSDIAEKMGVSVVTVSNALSGKKGVSRDLRDRIIEEALSMGYPYISHEPKNIRNTSNIGILVSEKFIQEHSIYQKIYQSVLLSASARSFSTSMETVPVNMDNSLYLPRLVQNHTVDGIILLGETDPQIVDKIRSLNIPYVFLDSYNLGDNSDAVLSENMNGSFQLTSLLIQEGHQDIRFLGSINDSSNTLDRYTGYLRALTNNNFHQADISPIPDRDNQGKFIPLQLPSKMPDAFVCSCDEIAYHLIILLIEKGYRIPQDVSVVGFNDSIFAALCQPPLTTFRADVDMMGKTAINLLIDKIEEKPIYHGKIILKSEMILRSSTTKHV